jgi:hypothetical protein
MVNSVEALDGAPRTGPLGSGEWWVIENIGATAMERIEVISKIGPDGMLRLALPVGVAEADHDVRVIVEPLGETGFVVPPDWEARLKALCGSWEGEFERAPQGEFEVRDTL